MLSFHKEKHNILPSPKQSLVFPLLHLKKKKILQNECKKEAGEIYLPGSIPNPGFSQWLSGKEPTCNAEDKGDRFYPWVEDPLEEGIATHYSILAWRIPWTEETVGCSP